MESEYVALASMVNLLREYAPVYEWFYPDLTKFPVTIHEDNQGAIKMAAHMSQRWLETFRSATTQNFYSMVMVFSIMIFHRKES